jgi:hypothetical protein
MHSNQTLIAIWRARRRLYNLRSVITRTSGADLLFKNFGHGGRHSMLDVCTAVAALCFAVCASCNSCQPLVGLVPLAGQLA